MNTHGLARQSERAEGASNVLLRHGHFSSMARRSVFMSNPGRAAHSLYQTGPRLHNQLARAARRPRPPGLYKNLTNLLCLPYTRGSSIAVVDNPSAEVARSRVDLSARRGGT